jgi:hypothetical protein
MFRLGLAVLLVAGCSESVDDRPLELEYLTQAIFAPSCGTTGCHSTFVQAANNVFDTPEGTRRSLIDHGLIVFDSTHYDPDDPNDALLIHWITDIDPLGLGIGRMPFDAPIPNKDVLLLKEWISAGAPGAECNAISGAACWKDPRNNRFYAANCNSDWTIDKTSLISCSAGCIQGMCQ